jgi:hypothetical protein
VCHFQVKLKAGYDPCVGSKITRLKTVSAVTPLLLAASALASSLPYSAMAQKDPTAELSALQDKWADHLASARQDAGPREAWRNDREHSWNPKAGDHRRYLGTSQTASSTGSSTTSSNAGAGDNTGLSSPWTGHALGFQPPSGLSNYVSQQGGAWENLWGRRPDDRLEDRSLHNFEGFHTMRKDPPASFDPPDPVPEPAYAGLLVAGLFAAGLFFYRRLQLHC